MDQRISLVVRGADILPCTPRQLLLFRLMGVPEPRYAHVPLLLDHEGNRLAKRHQACELRALRARGITARAVVGHLAFCAGLLPVSAAAAPRELLDGFEWGKSPAILSGLDLTLRNCYCEFHKVQQFQNESEKRGCL